LSNRRTILIVDDVPMFRELGSVFLARSGRVLTADGGEAALELARRQRPDLVLADLGMPGMDGAELCRAIKADPLLAGTPVIVMIGSDAPADRGRAARAGADDLLRKPLSRVALVETVNRFLAYETVRGLPRVELAQPTCLRVREATSWGVMRNLSRGGAFVETEVEIEPATELELQFELPEIEAEIAPSAEVVWQRPSNGLPAGLGLRFLDVDGRVARWLDEYIWEHSFLERSEDGCG